MKAKPKVSEEHAQRFQPESFKQMYLQGLFLFCMRHFQGCSPDSHRWEECWGREVSGGMTHRESRAPWQQTWKAKGEGVMPVTIQLLEESLISSVPSPSVCSRAPVNRFWTWLFPTKFPFKILLMTSYLQLSLTDKQRSWGFESFLEDKACTRAVSLLLSWSTLMSFKFCPGSLIRIQI